MSDAGIFISFSSHGGRDRLGLCPPKFFANTPVEASYCNPLPFFYRSSAEIQFIIALIISNDE